MLFSLGTAFEYPGLTEVMYLGEVEDNVDPEQIGRIKVRVKEVFGTAIPTKYLPWAIPFDSANAGSIAAITGLHIPEIGSQIIVFFHKQDIYSPVYTGRAIAKGQLFEDLVTNYPNRYGYKDSNLNQFWVDKSTGEMEVKHHSGTRVYIDDEGSVTIDVVKNQTTTIEEESVVVIKKNNDVTIEENNTILIKGDNALTVEGNMTADVTGNLTSTVGGNAESTVSGNLNATVTGASTIQTDSADVTVTGVSQIQTGSAQITASGNVEMIVGGVARLQAPTVEVTGANNTTLTSTNVTVQSTNVNLNATNVNIGQGGLEPLVLGNQLALWMANVLTPWLGAHVHTGNLGAPTSPPLAPFNPGPGASGGPVYSQTKKVN